MTFGPVGRLGWTAGLILVLLVSLYMGGPGGLLFDLMWVTVVMPLALKDIWAKTITYRPEPISPATSASGSAESLADFVAHQPVRLESD